MISAFLPISVTSFLYEQEKYLAANTILTDILICGIFFARLATKQPYGHF